MTLDRRNFLKAGASALALPALPLSRQSMQDLTFEKLKTPTIQTAYPASAIASNPQKAHPNTTGLPRLTEGPMVGAVTPTTINIWTRASDEWDMQIRYGTDRHMSDARETRPLKARSHDDLTRVITLTGLEPDTTYYYQVLVDHQPDRFLRHIPPFPVKTAPVEGSKARFRVAFGSCPRFQKDPVQKIWPAIEAWTPELFFSLGDYVYADSLRPQTIAECYRRQRNILSMQSLIRTTPNLAVWDDHDYGLNDSDRTSPVKEASLEIFKQYWANPSYGLPETPGVFFKYSYGGVDFFFLDDRYHRDPNLDPDVPGKTQLGKGQLAWLKRELKASDAIFKMLISGGVWGDEKGAGGDAWSAYLHERNHIFDFIKTEAITGVVLMAGDVHIGELNAIPWSERGGYDYYDLVSSPLAQSCSNDYVDRRPSLRIRPAYVKSPNAGIIDFDLTRDDPALTYQLIDTRGHAVWEPFVLYASELRNGVSSWRTKIDATSRERLEHAQRTGLYYSA